jgi:hypothetical protein
VKNDIRLHQFDLAGTEGDSLFEENFGISLSMALALLRDLQGNINLSVPLVVDREGKAQVDVMAAVRSALRRAITGAITSPLKMLGAVAGGKGAPILPSPVAFRLGRAEPTGKGAESAERLAAFLVSRPAMAVQLSSAATVADERWLHEQALLDDFADENFFERSLAFVTERGPRQRIRGYLETRRKNKKAKLSEARKSLLDDLRSDDGMAWVPASAWLTQVRIDAAAAGLRYDLAVDASGRGQPSALAAGLLSPGGSDAGTDLEAVVLLTLGAGALALVLVVAGRRLGARS